MFYHTDRLLFFFLSHFICIVVSRISLGYIVADYCHFLTQDLLLFHFSILSSTNQSQDSSVSIVKGC
jgi:hypothetical protein